MENLEIQTLKQQLLDAIFADPNKLFENAPFAPFAWNDKYKRGTWVSRKHIDGRNSRSGKGAYIADGHDDKHALVVDENGGETIEILSYWRRTTDEQFPNCPRLFQLYGITPPQYDPEQAQREQQRKDDTEKFLADIRAAYLGNAGAAVREYLQKPIEQGGRGWDIDTVQAMADYIGVITPDTFKQVEQLTGLTFRKDAEPGKFPIAIFSRSKNNGNIVYMKFRCIGSELKGGDKWLNPTKGQTSAGRNDVPPYNYENTSFLAFDGTQQAVIVESELCAARATVARIKNVIALRGSEGITPADVRLLRSKGCKTIVLLYDTETDPTKAQDTDKKLSRAIKNIQAGVANMKIKVAHIAESWNAKDPDELLSRYPDDGALTLQDTIAKAAPAWRWVADDYAKRYNNAITDDDREQITFDIISYVAQLKAQNSVWGVFGDRIFAEYVSQTGEVVTPETMAKAAERHTTDELFRQWQQTHDRLLQDLNNAKGDTRRQREIELELVHLQPPTADPETQFNGLTMEQAFADLYRDAERDIVTNYSLLYKGYNNNVEHLPIKLYCNGITYFAGGTSHGKSTILQNIAYDLLLQGKRVLYYGFEELKNDTLFEFINIHIHRVIPDALNLSKEGSVEGINAYLKVRDENVFDGWKRKSDFDTAPLDDRDRAVIAHEIQAFLHLYRGAADGERLLFVYDDNMTSPELVEHITARRERINPDAIFIDYVQYLTNDENPRSAQFEDLGRVSKDLIKINKTAGVPVVVAAQLKEKNNEKDPDKLRYTDIFGASSIAQGASAVYIVANGRKYTDDAKVDYFGQTRDFGLRDKMFIRLDKNRFGTCPAVGLFNYDGAQRYINPATLDDIKTVTIGTTDDDDDDIIL